MTVDEWYAEGRKRFGDDINQWRFTCPVCGYVASVQDYKNAGAPPNAAGFSCIGRYLEDYSEAFSKKPGPCNYAGGGLFRCNPVHVDGHENMFRFADVGMVENAAHA